MLAGHQRIRLEGVGRAVRDRPDRRRLQQHGRVVGTGRSRGGAERRGQRGGRAPSAEAKTLEIAYLSFAVANSYDAPMLGAAQAAAAAGNAKLTVFDANLDPAAQTKQLQDATASGKFDAIITQPLYGAGMVADVTNAINAGIAVGNIDQILGADNTTAESQIPGMMANVAFVPSELGRKIGELVVTACTDKQAEPVQRGLHLVGQGGRPRCHAQAGVRRPPPPAIPRSRSSPRANPSTRRLSASRRPRTCSRPTRT